MSLKETFALRAVRVYLVLSGLVAVATTLSPLFAVMGLELAIVLGVALPLFVAPTSARILVAARREGPVEARALARSVLVVAMAGLLIPLVAALASGLFRGYCDLAAGLLFVLLGPGIGVPLAALLGLVAASTSTRPRLATALALLVPLGSIALALARFVTTPAIFAYTHLVGFFPGSLYDADVVLEAPYATLRLASLALFALALLVLDVGFDGERLRLARFARAPGRAWLAAALAIGLLVVEAEGPALGHRSTRASIAQALGARLDGERCTVLVPRELPRQSAERLRDDCDFRVERAEEVLGVRHPGRITAFFFRSSDEKRRLMGASNTYIAKPWRDEVYLQLSGWPHPVLFHEIVHVVAGSVGRGPFRVSGGLEGLLPSAGIVEGVAVAVAWDEREGLTPHQWARTLLDTGHAPSIAATEGLGFLLQPASRAYTANGSFVRWILETRGSAVVRRLYETGSYEEALGVPLEDAEASWRAFLETVPLPPEALGMARLRFERPAIFGQICPHAVAALESELSAAMSSGDTERALARCADVLRLDAGQAEVRAARVALLARAGRFDEAEDELARLVGPPSAATPIVLSARSSLADGYFQHGERERARRLYEASLAVAQPEDARRQLEVRLYALDAGSGASSALREVLSPDPRETNDGATLLAAIGRLERADPSGLGPYLEARQLVARERFALARPRLEEALERGLPNASLRREAERLRAISLAASGRLDEAEHAFAVLAFEARAEERGSGREVEAEDWLARVRFFRARAARRD